MATCHFSTGPWRPSADHASLGSKDRSAALQTIKFETATPESMRGARLGTALRCLRLRSKRELIRKLGNSDRTGLELCRRPIFGTG
jgi:hypothetical protein